MRSAGERHVDIYEHQASGGRFEAWSDEEKLEWITGVLGNVPENRPAGSSFSGHSRINSYYSSVRTTPQGREVQELFWDMLFGSDRRRTSPGQKVTILTNFVQVRQDLLAGRRGSEMRAQISILRQVMRRRR
jgi:hypothetical protein